MSDNNKSTVGGRKANVLMGDLDKMHDKINKVSDSVSYLVGRIDATLPHLVTKDDLVGAITTHEKNCRRPSLYPAGGINGKLYGGIGAGLVAVAGAIYALIEILAK